MHSPTLSFFPNRTSLLALQWAVDHGLAFEGLETTSLIKRLTTAKEKKAKLDVAKGK